MPEPRQQPELRELPESRPSQPQTRTETSRAGRDRGDIDNRGRQSNSAAGPRVAVPRQGPPPRRDDDRRDGRWNGYTDRSRYRVYRPGTRASAYYVYPRSYYYRPYQFGYGPGGRGYFYFDVYYNSYIWHPRTVIRYSNYGTYGYPTGELRLQVKPRHAQVFVDGYYAGTVDDFDGIFQSLRLEDGDYRIEIVLPGYEPLDFDVRIFPGEKVTYRGDLIPELP
jgi:hypothetical protein